MRGREGREVSGRPESEWGGAGQGVARQTREREGDEGSRRAAKGREWNGREGKTVGGLWG